MGLDPGALIKTLNKTCLDALQAAAGLCLSRTNPSVEVEHWLVKLVEAPDTDLPRIFRHFEVDPSRLRRDLTRAIDGFRTGNAADADALAARSTSSSARPGCSASIQFQAPKVRSGVLLLALLDDEELGRHGPRRLARAGARSRPSRSRPNLMKLVAGSAEDAGPRPRRRRPATAGGPAPATAA